MAEAADSLDRDFFCRLNPGPPRFNEKDFERTFRMPRDLYESVRSDVMGYDAFFVQKADATGKEGASTDQKIYAAMQMLT